jgi:hypothetical protein
MRGSRARCGSNAWVGARTIRWMLCHAQHQCDAADQHSTDQSCRSKTERARKALLWYRCFLSLFHGKTPCRPSSPFLERERLCLLTRGIALLSHAYPYTLDSVAFLLVIHVLEIMY